jgi:hypothetical protein
MSWKSLATPLTVIIIGVIFTIAALSAPEQRISGGPANQYNAPQGTATPDTSICGSYPKPGSSDIPPECLALTTTPQTTTTSTVGGTGTPTTTTTVTPTTGTVAPSPPTVAVPTRTTSPLQPTEDSTQETTSIDVTPTLLDALSCVPGEQVLITGEGPPRAALLLYFGQRVVGGGSVPLSGSFSLPLVVGRERPGSYPVAVRVRGSEQVLRELTCVVPPTAPPTPIQSRRG